MENNKHFIKAGNKVMFKASTDGLDYNLEAGKVYTVEMDNWADEITLQVAPDLQMPSKLYITDEDRKFINKTLNYYKKSSGTTGVMLSGLKGSGKTVTAKIIANESNLPIILIDKGFRPSNLVKLFNKLEHVEVCIIMDEIDKLGEDYNDDYLLRILDGANSCGKKLMLFTCNDDEDVSEYLKDRCSRIRYWRSFNELSSSMIQAILDDKLDDKEEIKPLTDFILENFACISFDNVSSFADEVNEYPKDTFEELFEDMNLSSK